MNKSREIYVKNLNEEMGKIRGQVSFQVGNQVLEKTCDIVWDRVGKIVGNQVCVWNQDHVWRQIMGDIHEEFE
jgi:hypothetical protein